MKQNESKLNEMNMKYKTDAVTKGHLDKVRADIDSFTTRVDKLEGYRLFMHLSEYETSSGEGTTREKASQTNP